MKSIRAIYRREMLKFIRNKPEVITSIFMGILFMFIFMWAGNGTTSEITDFNQEEYMVSGIVVMTAFMGAFTGALSIINDKSTGFMKEFLIAPIRREFIVFAKVFALMTQSLITMTAILLISILIPEVKFSVINMMNILIIGLGAAFVSAALGIFFSTIISTTSGFMAMQSIFVMPMMFISGAYIPLSQLPSFIQTLSYINPMTYLVALIRGVGSNGNLSEEIKDVMFINLKINNFTLEPWMMWVIVIVLAVILLLISLKKFKNINMSSKIDYNEML